MIPFRMIIQSLILSQIITMSFCQNISYPMVKKCACKFNEAESNAGCVEFSNQSIQFWNTLEEPEKVNTGDLQSTLVFDGPLTCPENMTKVKEFKDHYFFVDITDGKLFTDGPSTEQLLYCIENYVADGNLIGQRVERCINNIVVPLCCPLDQLLDLHGICTSEVVNVQNEINPDALIEWFETFEQNIRPVTCEGITEFSLMPMVDDKLEFDSILDNFKMQTIDNYCLAIHFAGDSYLPVINYCKETMVKGPEITEVPYCCLDHEIFDLNSQSCINHTENFVFPMSNVEWPENALPVSTLTCDIGFSTLTFEEGKRYWINSEGTLRIRDDETSAIPKDKYCLGGTWNGTTLEHTGLQCIVHDIQYNFRFYVQRIFFSISSIFIFATLVVYLGVTDLRRKIGGFCLISELVAILISHITLIILLDPNPTRFSNPHGCLAAGIIIIISTLASFFWLNVMCYDVWSTFRKLRPFSEKNTPIKLMIKYSLYAWGLPILIGIAAVICQKRDVFINPNFVPHDTCFFSAHDLAAQWVFMYGFILLITLMNLGFFIHLAIIMKPCKSDKKNVLKERPGSSRINKANAESCKLCVKLFIIMGLPWVLEVSTSLTSANVMAYIWILDIFNLLRGVFIFIVYICKERTKKLIIAQWFPHLKPSRDLSDSSSRDRKTSMMSLSSWLPSIKGSRVSRNSSSSINTNASKSSQESNPNPLIS